MEGQLVTPLRKKRLRTEELYTRVPEIEAKLVELEGLSRDDLLACIQIRRRDDPGYIPSECLLYFVRASRADNSTCQRRTDNAAAAGVKVQHGRKQ